MKAKIRGAENWREELGKELLRELQAKQLQELPQGWDTLRSKQPGKRDYTEHLGYLVENQETPHIKVGKL